jgi:SSS family solute:Na+ symporter
MAAVFVMGVFWKRCTTLAANITLTFGTIFSIGSGILYLWVIPGATEAVHFMMLSFYIFVVLVAMMVVVSLCNKQATVDTKVVKLAEKPKRGVIMAWTALAVVMVALYVFFNGN